MSHKSACWLLSGGCILVAGWLLIAVWAREDAARDAGFADHFGAVKEESRRERPNAIAIAPSGRKSSRPRAPLEAGWRELPIDKAIVHSVSGARNWNCVYWSGHIIPRAFELKLGRVGWVIYFGGLNDSLANLISNALERYVGMTLEQYVLSKRGVILRIGDLEIRLLGGLEVIARSVGGIIVSEDAAGVVFLPEDATVGELFKASNNRDGRTNRRMLARWFRDVCQHQRRNHVPQVKAGSPFCLFSSLCPGEGAIYDHDIGCVEVKSLRIRGNRIVLKVNFRNQWLSRRSFDWWLPLVEVPISDCLPVGRYSVQVDWDREGAEDKEPPCGSHAFNFDVVK